MTPRQREAYQGIVSGPRKGAAGPFNALLPSPRSRIACSARRVRPLPELPPIAEDRRRPASEFWREFEAARPRILGALLDAVSQALRRAPGVRLPRLPRMADFAIWVTAAAPALGWSGDYFDSPAR
jgi:hypothetical protein